MKIRTKIILAFLIIVILGFGAIFAIDGYVKHSSKNYIFSPDEAEKLRDVDCIIVLGCQVKSNGNPSDMLKDRLIRGISLYDSGVSEKIIMSGDHGRTEYDEVNAMKAFAVKNGVPSSDVFMDHAGFSTYESMYRAKEIFNADKIVIVSQEYHLYRAIYIARSLGIEAYGVSADYQTYLGQSYRDVREILARCKDFIKTIFKPEPTFLGETIPVSGDGDTTND